MKDHQQFLENSLFRERYLLAEELNKQLQGKFKNVTATNGRKIISRAAESGMILASPITFGKNQFAYIHPKKKFTKEIVLEIAEQKRPALFRVIQMLDVNNGVLSLYEAQKIAATPLKNGTTRNDSVDKIFAEIILLGFAVQVVNSDGVRFLVYEKFSKNPEPLMAKAIKQMSIDATFIPDVLRALQRFNIISSQNVLYRRKHEPYFGATQNNYIWDALGYTKATGINPGRASDANVLEKQTLVVLDLVVTRQYTDHDLQGFYSRIQGTVNSVKTGTRKVVPVVVYAKIASKALLYRIRKLGFLSFDVGSIYGTNIYRIIEGIQSIKNLKDFSERSIDDMVEETLDLIGNSGQEVNLSNLKGDLFESLMFPVLQAMVPQADIEQSREIGGQQGDTFKRYEYDYIIKSSRLKEILVVELKGYTGTRYIHLGEPDKQNTIQWFFNNSFPFAKSILNKSELGYTITGCYITTADFSEEGKEHLDQLQKSKIKPSSMDVWYNGNKLIELLEERKFTKILSVIRKYYIKPVSSQINVPFTPTEDAIMEELGPFDEGFEIISLEKLQ